MVQTAADARLADVRRRRRLMHSGLVEQLAVLAEFDPSRLEGEDTADVIRFFCSSVPPPTDRPLFVLSAKSRLDAFTSILQHGGAAGLTAVRKGTTPHVHTPLQRMLDVFTMQGRSAAEELDEDELLAALEVWRWATESAAHARITAGVRIPFDRDAIEGRLASLDVTRAVRRLAHRGCIGREEQLARLRGYVDEPSGDTGLVNDPAMVVYGIGGVGKSTLVARFVMDLVNGRADRPSAEDVDRGGVDGFSGEEPAEGGIGEYPGAWAYLDMDRPTLRNYEPEAILDEIVRQVAAQLPEGRRLLEGVRREAARRSKGAGLETYDAPPLYGAADDLARSLANLGRDKLVVILDTFEEVTLAAPERPVQIFDLFDLLGGRIETLKLIISGRAPAAPFAQGNDRILHLTDFTGDAAVRLLRHFLAAAADGEEVHIDATLAREVVDTVGGNPLTLQLAAGVLASEGWQGFDEEARHAAVDRVRHEFIQGFLYRRILEHVEASDAAATDELRTVAKAALVLRRVTPQLLADAVLPSVGVQSDRDATWFYSELEHEVAFVERYADHLRVREELRGPAVIAVGYEDQALVDRVHRAAAAHYAARRAVDPDAREELAYHQLALGVPLADLELDHAAIARVAGSLPTLPAGAAAEPRAPWAQSSAELSAEREQLGWERRVWSEADAALSSGRLEDVRNLLNERRTRRPDTQLYRIESRLHEAEGDLPTALRLSRQDLAASDVAGDRTRFAAAALRAAELEERLGREVAADTLRSAADNALLAGDPGLRLELHLNRMTTLERMERLDEDQRWYLELDARALLARIPPGEVAENTALIKLLAATLGRDQPALVRSAAIQVGLGPDEDPARLRRLAAAVAKWDRDQDDLGRLARVLGIGTAGPVDESTWVSALAGLGPEVGQRLDKLWETEEPPRDVREALRALYLWWGAIPAARDGEQADWAHLFDRPLDFSRPEAQQLHRIVLDGYGNPQSLFSLADRAGIDPRSVDVKGSPDAMVRSFLLQASAKGLLQRVVEVILDDPSAGTLATVLRDLVERPQAV
jgi:hypothetical protein